MTLLLLALLLVPLALYASAWAFTTAYFWMLKS